MNIRKSIQIDATLEQLWELLINPERVKRWSPSVISDEPISSGPVRAGFRSKMKIDEGSKIVEYDSEITTYEPMSHLGLELKGGSLGRGPMYIDYMLKSETAGTILTYESRWQAHGFMLKLMSPLLYVLSQRNISAQMARLKNIAEESSNGKE
jgi:carbon monoxide dehydrogenase subunit G